MQLRTLKRSAEFRRVRGGGRFATDAFLIEGKARSADPAAPIAATAAPAMAAPAGVPARRAGHGAPPAARFGFTVTKKLGGAVVRNRIRRRLKAAVRALDADAARPDHDYVIVARPRALDQPFAELAADLARGLRKVGQGGKPRAQDKPRAQEPPGKSIRPGDRKAGARTPGGSAGAGSRPTAVRAQRRQPGASTDT